MPLNNLNIFLGANSTGKSSILRFFPLIKQTISRKNNEPLLWYDPQGVDFGSYDDSVNKNNKSSGITFSFCYDLFSEETQYLSKTYILLLAFKKKYGNFNKEIDNMEYLRYRILGEESAELDTSNINLTMNIKDNGYDYIEIKQKNIKFKLKLNDKSLQINDQQFDIPEVTILKEDFNLIPTFLYGENLKIFSMFMADKLIELLFSDINENIKTKTMTDLLKQMRFEDSSENFFNKHIFQKKVPITIKEKFKNKQKQEEFYCLFCGLYIFDLLEESNKYFNQYFDNVTYIAPVRASAERYYRVQGLSVDDVDSMGVNVPMMLYSMKGTSEYNDWNRWTKDNFGIQYTVKNNEGHSAVMVQTDYGEYNLADTGFGYSQLLPVLLVLWKQQLEPTKSKKYRYSRMGNFNIPQTIIIEQPELHLHPAMQSQIADLLMKMISNNNNVSFIIETHSVAMINRIGEIIEHENNTDDSKENLQDKINIFLVNPYSDKEKSIIKTSYDDEGIIKEWPVGFLSGGSF